MQRVLRADAITREELHRRLREWISKTKDIQIGDEGVKGVTPWIHLRHEGVKYKLHADTKRHAIEWYLEKLDLLGEDLVWSIVPNQRGNENAVAIGPEKLRAEGFYVYSVK